MVGWLWLHYVLSTVLPVDLSYVIVLKREYLSLNCSNDSFYIHVRVGERFQKVGNWTITRVVDNSDFEGLKIIAMSTFTRPPAKTNRPSPQLLYREQILAISSEGPDGALVSTPSHSFHVVGVGVELRGHDLFIV